ncbi:MAG: hypothetical protein P4L38_08190 [Syntrophaceae bacterium]|nr:hypothetical protein [Syntrophaceae bacterium]
MQGVPRFKRIHAEEGHGTPLFSSADVMRTRFIPSALLSPKRNAREINICRVDEGTILVPCSGTYGGILGRAVRVGKYLHEKAITQHVVRVKVTDKRFNVDYVTGILSSLHVGYPMITAFRYGKDVPEIDPRDIATMPIPLLDKKDQERFACLIQQGWAAIDDANYIQDEAQMSLCDALKIPTEYELI